MKTIKLSELEELITKYSNQENGMRPLMLLFDTTSTYRSVKEIVLNIKDERRTYALNSGDMMVLGGLGILPCDRIVVDSLHLPTLEQAEILIGFSRDSAAQVIYLLSNKDLDYLRWLKDHPEENTKYHYNEELLENNFDIYTIVSSQSEE